MWARYDYVSTRGALFPLKSDIHKGFQVALSHLIVLVNYY